jgi:hypothetical protein
MNNSEDVMGGERVLIHYLDDIMKAVCGNKD